MNSNQYCIIMAGGSGTRFWPLSRTDSPKQFLEILDTGKTFIRSTYERFAKFILPENIIIVTTARYRERILREVPELLPENLLIEPYGRNTAPCIAYATYTLLKRNPDAVTVVSPTDQVIENEEGFRETMLGALDYARQNKVLVAVGVRPTRPDSNYGYIQVTGGKDACNGTGAMKVKTFTEKPDKALAKVFVDSGEFFWNSGIFAWRAQAIRENLERYLPEITNLFKGWEKAIGSRAEGEFIERAYTDCINKSLDYALMEKAEDVWLYPAGFRWADIGAWDSLHEILPRKDPDGNAVLADKSLISEDKGNLIISENKGKLMAVKGLENFIVIDTPDVLLICPKDEKKFKDFVSGLGMPGYENYK